MNQILSTGNSKPGKKHKQKQKKGGVVISNEIGKIVKFFAICLVIFGVFLIASSSYAIYKSQNEKSAAEDKRKEVKPTVRIESKGKNQAIITVIHSETEITSVEYFWEYGKEVTIDGEGRKFIQTTIDVPTGESVLTVTAKDAYGNVTTQSQDFIIKGAINIDIAQSGNNVQVTATGENELKTIKYSWDEDKPTEAEINNNEYSIKLEILLGEHELHVVVTDAEGNEEEKSITVKGTTKPTATIEAGNDCYLIKAHDDVGLSKVVIETVEDGKLTTLESDGKDFEYEFPLKDGSENYIKVTAYNKYGVASKTRKAVWNK